MGKSRKNQGITPDPASSFPGESLRLPGEILDVLQQILDALKSKVAEQKPEEQEETTLDVIGADNMRNLINKAVSLGIHKEDVVQIVPADGMFFMVYE